MKSSRRSWIFLVIGVFIFALAVPGVIRLQQIQEKNLLTSELALVEQKLKRYQLEQLSSQQEEPDETTPQPGTEEAILTQPPGSITTNDTLYSTAAACGVEVIENSASGSANGNLEGITCYVLELSTTVGGSLNNLINFITMLNRDLTNGIVKSVNIDIPEAAGGGVPTANLQMTVYTYQGN